MKKSFLGVFFITLSLFFVVVFKTQGQKNNAEKARFEIFADTIKLIKWTIPKLIDSVNIPSVIKTFDPKDLLGLDSNKAIANFFDNNHYWWKLIFPKFEKISINSEFKLKIWETKEIEVNEKELNSQLNYLETSIKSLSENELVIALIYLISRQPHGESGILTTQKGQSNSFFFQTNSGKDASIEVWWYKRINAWVFGGGPKGVGDLSFSR